MRFLITFISLFLLAASVQAEPLAAINNVNAQADRLNALGAITGRRVTDDTNRVVGEIDDIVIDLNGNIRAYLVDLKRQGVVPVSPGLVVRRSKGAYALNFHRDDLARLAASIEPAAGNAAPVRATRLIGRDIRTQGGTYVGKIRAVLLNDSNTSVRAYQIKRKTETFLIPANSKLGIASGGDLVMADDFARGVGRYLSE